MDVREKLVKQAISHFRHGVSHDIFSEPVTTYAKLAIEALEKENGVMVQEWISVEDRLPEKDGAYLVTTNSFGDRQRVKLRWFAKDGENVDAYALAGQKDVWYLYDIECGYVSINSVTNWMPMPSTEGIEDDT